MNGLFPRAVRRTNIGETMDCQKVKQTPALTFCTE